MYEILFRIPLPFTDRAFPVRSYGVMAMIGFLAAVLVARWRAKKVGISADGITDVGLWALLGGIVGSRLFYVIQIDRFRPDWSFADVFKIWEGGLVFYGGFIAALIAVVIMARIKKIRLLAVWDVLAPSLALGHAFGRIGCLLRGCCYGVKMEHGSWCGVVFPPNAPAYDPRALRPIAAGTPVFPSQILSVLDLLAIFVILSLFFKHRRAEGRVTALYLVLYSVHRFVIEFLRGDTRLPGALSTAQWLSIPVFFFGLGLLVYLREGAQETKRPSRTD